MNALQFEISGRGTSEMTTDTLINLIIAIATIATIVVALITWMASSADAKRCRVTDFYLKQKENALLVDAWIGVREDNKRCLILQNNSSAAIRDVSMVVTWHGQPGVCVPGKKWTWAIIPQGTWRIEHASKQQGYDWGLPTAVPPDSPYASPQFFRGGMPQRASEAMNSRGQSSTPNCSITSFSFSDASGNVWNRCYPCSENKGTHIALTASEDDRLARFVKKAHSPHNSSR